MVHKYGPTEDNYSFVTRKNCHSNNVQGICDHEGKQIVIFSSIKKCSERKKKSFCTMSCNMKQFIKVELLLHSFAKR